MRCNWRRWLWGVIPLLGLGLAAAQLERGAIERDLTERAELALREGGARWARVNFSGRDVILTGNAIQDSEPGEAKRILLSVWGVGNVNNNAGLPPKVEPFVWSARRRGNRVRLSGYVRDRATRQVIIGMTKAALPDLVVTDRMRVARGAPPDDTWLAGLSFALKQLASLKRGEVQLEDLAMTISGEAEDAPGYRAVSAALKRGLPKGLTLASAQISAPVVSPYTWSAQFAGGQLVLSGYVAGEQARAELLAAAGTAPAGTAVVDRMEPAGGAPASGVEAAAALIKEMVRLQSSSAEMKDATLTFGGIAEDEAQARAIRGALRASVPSSFTLIDQIRVREPKVEVKPPAEPAPADRPKGEAAPAPPALEPQPKVTAPAEPAPADPQPKEASPAPPPEPAPKVAPAPPEPKVALAPPPDPPRAAPPPEPAPKVAPAPPEPEPKVALAPPPDPPRAALPEAPPKAAPAPAATACRDELSKIAGTSPIAFESGSAKIEAAALDALNRLAAAVKACPGVRLAIAGHTDVEGSAEYNQRLSVRRAQAVADYLVGAGVGAGQVEAAGFGSTRPVAPNDTSDARARNRRTEITVRR